MNNSFYLEYPLEKERFTAEDLKVVELLKLAARKTGEIFAKQADGNLPGAGFYPSDATKQEVEKAAEKDPLILDPYTIVKRDGKGELYAVPYHKEYEIELKEISELFIKASKVVENGSFKHYLEVAAREFLNGNYRELEKAWLGISYDSFLHAMVGPLGTYADRLFDAKNAYNFNLTYTSSDTYFNPLNYVEIIRNMLPPFGSKARQDVPPEKIKIRVDNVAAIGGRNAALPARAVNYPEDVDTMRDYGIKIVVYTNNIQRRDGKMLLPLLRDLMDKEVHKSFTDEFIMANAIRLVMVHEITEAIFQYPGAWKRLKGMFNPVYEFHSSIVGIKGCGFQVIKGALSQKDLEAILYVMLMRTFSDYFVRMKSPQVENYLLGYRLFFNYCIENGAIKLEGDSILPNPSKIYVCADQIANVIMHLYDEGTEKEAREFFDKYTSEHMYKHFSAKLSKYEF